MRTAALKMFMTMAAVVLIAGCSDPSRIIDDNAAIPNYNWAYANKVKYHVNITDVSVPYNLYINARVTGDYKYANLFVLVHTTGPGIKPGVMRYELKLANNEGEWLGSGSGNLYSFQIPFKLKHKFPTAGTYHFSIEQNMRDNPLRQVSDIGMRVEKAESE